MQPYYERSGIRLYHGDAADVLPTLDAESISAVVSDPPAGIAFMSKAWDRDKGGRDQWVAWLASILSECNRAMKPGAHAVIWALPRTSGWTHRAIEDAGLDVRDCVTHLFGSGFPKSHDVSKAIDKLAGAERETWEVPRNGCPGGKSDHIGQISAERKSGIGLASSPATPEAEQWQGWGTSLKPAAEFWYLARKPLSGTVAANVLAHGTGALNIDASRVAAPDDRKPTFGPGWDALHVRDHEQGYRPGTYQQGSRASNPHTAGRWPPNVILDPDAAAQLDQMSGERKSGGGNKRNTTPNQFRARIQHRDDHPDYSGDTGGASRFFPVLPIDDPDTLRMLYTPKASRRERNAGLDGLPDHDREGQSSWAGVCNVCGCRMMLNGKTTCGHGDMRWVVGKPQKNHHPTVKPLALMRWLLTLVTPPGGTVIDPFAGSGTTGVACAELGLSCVLIEQEAEYLPIIAGRIDHALDARAGAELPLFAGVAD